MFFFCVLAGLLHNKNLNAAKYAYSFCPPKKTPDRGIYKTTEQFVNSHGHHQLNKNKYWSLFLTNAFTDVFQTNPFDGALAFISFYLYIYIYINKKTQYKTSTTTIYLGIPPTHLARPLWQPAFRPVSTGDWRGGVKTKMVGHTVVGNLWRISIIYSISRNNKNRISCQQLFTKPFLGVMHYI